VSSHEAISPEELALLYDEHSAAVHRLAFSLLSQRQEAEDLTHDVFLRLQRGGFDSNRGEIRQYLLLLTRSMGINRINKHRNRRRILERFRPAHSQQDPMDLQSVDARYQLERALAQLSSREQQILAMNYHQDISQSNIAESLHLPLGTVKTISRRALLKLRNALSSQEEN
jgi:RNA polymerase sigma-70 factor (ECF subfamily)